MTNHNKCRYCNGHGVTKVCNAEGVYIDIRCEYCRGTGKEQKETALDSIPFDKLLAATLNAASRKGLKVIVKIRHS